MSDSQQSIKIDRIIRSDRKTVSLEVQKNGALLVRAPHFVSHLQIDSLVRSKQNWIKKKQELVKTQLNEIQKKKFISGERFLFLGEDYLLEVVKNQSEPLILRDKFYLAEKFNGQGRHLFEDWYKQRAREEVAQLAKLHSLKDGFSYSKIRITSAKTRWGSCGLKGSLNFTWRLVMAPLEVIDYVVVHELVHLEIKDHSRNYWDAVGGVMPNYQKYRKWLKENGHRLTLD